MAKPKIPAVKGDKVRARKIEPKQAAQQYANDKAGGGDFYCTGCRDWFATSALDSHAGH